MRRSQSYRFPFASIPAVRIMLLLMTGIVFAHTIKYSFFLLAILFTGTATGWFMADFVIRKKFNVAASRLAMFLYFMMIPLSAAMWVCMNDYRRAVYIENTSVLQTYEWEDLELNGRVVSTGQSTGGRDVYVVDVEKTIFPEGVEWNYPYKIRLYGDTFKNQNSQNRDKSRTGVDIEGSPSASLPELQPGTGIRAKIRLYGFPERRNPHEFDYGEWLYIQEIVAHGELISWVANTDRSQTGWATLRSSVHRNVDSLFDKTHASLAKALLFGYKEELTPETRQQFARAGLSHIMAVSGLHVGFIVAPFWVIIPYLWGSKWWKWIGLLMLTLLLLGYAGLTGFSASVCRASLMAWLLTYGKLFHKIRNSINLTAVAAIILLIIEPRQLFDIGFQLSFSAVFIILLLMPQAQRIIPQRYRFGKTGAFLSIFIISVVVQLGLFPILVTYFGEFSIIGPVANALVVPLLSITVPVGILFSILSPVFPALFRIGVIPVQYSLEWIQMVASGLGGFEGSYITVQHSMPSLFLLWLSCILFLASIRVPAMRWKLFVIFLLATNLFMIETHLKKPSHKPLQVTFLDVGQGDAVHIQTPEGKHVLIDAGRWSPLGNSGDRVLLPYLRYKGINRINALILSHPHADHIGGVPALLENFIVDKIYQSNYLYDSILYNQYMNMAHEKDIPVNTPAAGDRIDVDSSIRIFVLGPERETPQPRNPNNHSLAVKVVYGKTSFLFSGDAETEQERQIARRYGDFLKADLYKAGHHASNTSSTKPFMQFVEPQITVASLAFRNVFGHPGTEAVTRLHHYSRQQKYTSLQGAVRYESDGNTLRYIDWR